MQTAELQFNIIFTPDTAEYLSPFIDTLLEWSDCRYRIVANGCSEQDRNFLCRMCDGHERLDYLVASEDTMLEHGLVLDWLHERTESRWFCFLDSDILATGLYMDAVATHLEECDVFSAGHPLWYAQEDIELPPHFRRLQGSYFGTTDGKNLGGTYFAIYNNELLTRVMKETGVGFRYYFWKDIPQQHQATLKKIGLEKIDYDTGKLLMSLMLANGARFRSEDLPNLRHLGGFSAKAGDGKPVLYRGVADRLASTILGGALARPLLYLADIWYAVKTTQPGISAEESRSLPLNERRVFQSRIRKRINTARYFNVLLRSLRTGQAEPSDPVLGCSAAEQRIREVVPVLRKLWSASPTPTSGA